MTRSLLFLLPLLGGCTAHLEARGFPNATTAANPRCVVNCQAVIVTVPPGPDALDQAKKAAPEILEDSPAGAKISIEP